MRAKIRLIALLHLAGLGGMAHAQVFGGQDASGAVVLSNFQSEAASNIIVSAPVVQIDRTAPIETPELKQQGLARILRIPELPDRLRPLIRDAAVEHNLPPNLIQAVIAVESGYNPNAVSRTGAKGLMQLMPQTASRFGVTDVYDQRANVRGGAQYLKWLLGTFEGDIELALAGYNAGENAVIRSGYKIPPFRETQDYVPKVLAVYRQLTAQGSR
jgi:soluble lytic murein transglycosylase-like protein